MSGLLTNRTWLGGAALVAAFGFAACSDDSGSADTAAAGKNAGGSAGSAGSHHAGAGGESTAGSSSGGKGGAAGNGGTGTAGSAGNAGNGAAGDPQSLGGEAGMAGSGGEAGAGGATDAYAALRAKFAGMSPLPAVPADTTNSFADSDAAAALGQRFFFDEKFSGPLKADSDLGVTGDTQKVSCKSCHSGAALDDERSMPRTVSKGTGLHTRNSPALVNSAFYTWTNWGGRFSSQWELPLAVVENGVIMNGNRLALAHRIFDVYKADYEAVFGAMTPEIGTDATRFPAAGKPKAAAGDPDGAWEGMQAADRVIINRILVNYSKALQAYVRKLVSRDAPFDAFMAGDDGALSSSALKGAELFVGKAGCINCHSGPHFSDEGFHDLGVPQTGMNNIPAADDGRFKDTPALVNSTFNRDGDFSDDKTTGKLASIPALPLPDTWKGLFRTASLRGVALSAPYMHSGQLATLEEVIDFYKDGGTADTRPGELTPFSITPQEKADLIAFLSSLTGKPVPAALLTDTAAP